MSNQQQESSTPVKGGSGNVSSNPDKSTQTGQKSSRDPRQGGSDQSDPQRGSSKSIETEPDRAQRASQDDSERSRVGK